MGKPLAEILAAAANGVFPPADGRTTIVPQAAPRDAGVFAFTGHSVVFVDEDPDWVRNALGKAECDPLAATMNPRFLTALMDRTDRVADTIDLLTVADALPGEPSLPLREIADPDHPRIRRARAHRDGVRAWSTEGGVLVVGRGVAGRWEIAIEVDEPARHHGLGRALATAGRHLIPNGEALWAQISAGNARSIRAFEAAGFRPVASEILLSRRTA
jgi:hypothetical protein